MKHLPSPTFALLLSILLTVYQPVDVAGAARKPVKLLPNEESLLAKLHVLGAKEDSEILTPAEQTELTSTREELKKLYARISEAKLFERLLDICSGGVDGAAKVGAARLLSSFRGTTVVPYLKKGLEISLPSGVSYFCANGLAERCRGSEMTRTITMLESTNQKESDYAFKVLSHVELVRHRSQLEEMKAVHSRMKPGKYKEVIGAFISSMSRSKLKDD